VNVGRTLGWLAYQAGDYNWSASLLQDAARKLENDPEVSYQAALATYSIGKVADAENLMQEALTSGSGAKPGGFLPGLASSPASVSASTSGLAEEAQAREFLDLIALAAKPDPARRAAIDAALKSDPANVPALMALGALQEQETDAAGARQAYEKALTRFSDFAPAKLRLAVLAVSAQEFDPKALELAQQARTAFPSDPDAAKALGILTTRKGGDPVRAISLLRQTLSARPDDAEALYYLGVAQIQNKDQSAGRASLKKSIDAGLRSDLAMEARKAIEAK
jgi:tetratricopeptide (TPR) repeat protein